MFHGNAGKTEQAVEGVNGTTQRTAGTADTTQKTCESANNSNSHKGSGGNVTAIASNRGKLSGGFPQRPPRDGSTHQRSRPQTSAPQSSQVAWRFYQYQNNEKQNSESNDGLAAYGKGSSTATSNGFRGSGTNPSMANSKNGLVSLSVERNIGKQRSTAL